MRPFSASFPPPLLVSNAPRRGKMRLPTPLRGRERKGGGVSRAFPDRLFASDFLCKEKEIVLEAGDSALFYSDGLVEAHDPKGEMFGFPRLRALVADHGENLSLGHFLLEELYSFVGEGWEQEDDITLLTLRRSAARS